MTEDTDCVNICLKIVLPKNEKMLREIAEKRQTNSSLPNYKGNRKYTFSR